MFYRIVFCGLAFLVTVSTALAQQGPTTLAQRGPTIVNARFVTFKTNLPLNDELKSLPLLLDFVLVKQAEVLIPSMTHRRMVFQKLVRERMTAILLDDKLPVPAAIQREMGPSATNANVAGVALPKKYITHTQKAWENTYSTLLHEQTHALMKFVYTASGPSWYEESLAECFSNFKLTENKKGIEPRTVLQMPVRDEQAGRIYYLGRVTSFQELLKRKPNLGLDDIFRAHVTESTAWRPALDIPPNQLLPLTYSEGYSLVWAFGIWMSNNPKYSKFFYLASSSVKHKNFTTLFRRALGASLPAFRQHWLAFAADLELGYDFERSRIEKVRLRRNKGIYEFDLDSARGWSDSGISIRAGQTMQIAAQGTFRVAKDPSSEKTLEADADGNVKGSYRGEALGKLLVVPAPTLKELTGTGIVSVPNPFLKPQAVGKLGEITAQKDGVLFFRLNDSPAELHDNEGKVKVFVRLKPKA